MTRGLRVMMLAAGVFEQIRIGNVTAKIAVGDRADEVSLAVHNAQNAKLLGRHFQNGITHESFVHGMIGSAVPVCITLATVRMLAPSLPPG